MLDNQVVKGVTGPSNGGPCKTPNSMISAQMYRYLVGGSTHGKP